MRRRLSRGMGELARQRRPDAPKLNHDAIKALVVANTSMR